MWVLAMLLLELASAVPAAAGQNPVSAEATAQRTQPTFTLQAERNVVLVRVVVRDSKGQPVGHLRKEDFRLLDNGKPQAITHFAVEVPPSRLATEVPAGQKQVHTEEPLGTAAASSAPQRYLALYFDDVHAKFEDLARSRDAADRYLAAPLQAGDRVGIFTSSGQQTLGFSDDRDKLHEALFKLRPWLIMAPRAGACPDISEYQAYMILEVNNPRALEVAAEETLRCNGEEPTPVNREMARRQATSAARGVLDSQKMRAGYALGGLEQLVRRMAVLPGQRSIVVVSPGFIAFNLPARVSEITDHALGANVIINALDAKGLYAPIPFGDASVSGFGSGQNPLVAVDKVGITLESLSRASDVLSTLARDTGGEFFHSNNDLSAGFRKLGALPEVYYLLAFSPQNLKADGRFHSLKVNLVSSRGLSVQARRGYYAPKRLDAVAQAKAEIREAIYSPDTRNEIPIEIRTEFSKVNDSDAKLSVLIHIDTRSVRFRKKKGWNLNTIEWYTVLFDREGKYLIAKGNRVDLRLPDESLNTSAANGIYARASFSVRPGTYVVRQVVRDTEGGQLSSVSRTVDIAF